MSDVKTDDLAPQTGVDAASNVSVPTDVKLSIEKSTPLHCEGNKKGFFDVEQTIAVQYDAEAVVEKPSFAGSDFAHVEVIKEVKSEVAATENVTETREVSERGAEKMDQSESTAVEKVGKLLKDDSLAKLKKPTSADVAFSDLGSPTSDIKDVASEMIASVTDDDVTLSHHEIVCEPADVVVTDEIAGNDFVVEPDFSDDFAVQEVIAEEEFAGKDGDVQENKADDVISSEVDKKAETAAESTPCHPASSEPPSHDSTKTEPIESVNQPIFQLSKPIPTPAVQQPESIQTSRPLVKETKTTILPESSPKLVPIKSTTGLLGPSLPFESNKLERTSHEKETGKSAKMDSEGKERKMPSDKKSKLDKTKKERKEEKKISKPDKLSSKSSHGVLKADRPADKADRPADKADRPADKADRPFGKADRPADKADRPFGKADRPFGKADRPADKSVKKLVKEEKGKSSVSSSKIKPFKPSDKSTGGSKDRGSSEEKHKKDSKLVRKPDSTADVGEASITSESKKHEPVHKTHKSMEKPHKHSESDKKLSSKNAGDKKMKALKESEKSSAVKKAKLDESQKSSTKSHSVSKESKKEKHKPTDPFRKESPHASKSDTKAKLKSKHRKPHSDSTHEPAKKRVKLESEPLSQSKPLPASSNSDSSEDLSDHGPTKKVTLEAKAKSTFLAMPNENIKKSDKTQSPKPKPKPVEQRGIISSDSDSSDNYDNFISLLSGGTSKSAFENKATASAAKTIYTSSDDSDESDHEIKSRSKTKVKKLSKSEKYDSDKSDRSVKKFQSKSTTDAGKVKKKSKNIKSEKTSSDKMLKKSEKAVVKSKSADKKSVKVAADKVTDPDKSFKKSASSKAKQLFDSDLETSSSDNETEFSKRKKPHEQAAKKKMLKKSGDSTPIKDEGHKKNKLIKPSVTSATVSPAKKDEKRGSKESSWLLVSSMSSSDDSSDHPPPHPSSSSSLTVETIKEQPVVPSNYRLDSLDSSKWQEKSPKTKSLKGIYTSSDSSDDDSDGERTLKDMAAEEQKTFLGSTSSSDQSPERSEIFAKVTLSEKPMPESKRFHPHEQKEFKKTELPATREPSSTTETSKPAKVMPAEHKKEMRLSKSHPGIEKTKPYHEQRTKMVKKDDKSEAKVPKEKSDLSKTKSFEQKVHKKVKHNEQEKQRKHLKHVEEKHKKVDKSHSGKQHADKPHRSSQTDALKAEKHEKAKTDKSHSASSVVKHGHKEKKSRPEGSHSSTKPEEKAKTLKDTSHHLKHLKHKSKEHFGNKEQTEQKQTKPTKERKPEQIKVKKEGKIKTTTVPERKFSDHGSESKLEKKVSKFSRPQISKEISKKLPEVTYSSEEAKPKIDKSLPGSSFFDSDSDSDHAALQIKEEETHISVHKPDFDPSQSVTPSIQPIQKSMFSPTKDDIGSSSDSEKLEDSFAPEAHSSMFSPPRSDSPAPHCSEKDSGYWRSSKHEETTEDESQKAKKSSTSPSDRTQKLSSYEKFQIEQAKLKKLSQQRDEEAVRSIMADDNATSLAGESVEYFSGSAKPLSDSASDFHANLSQRSSMSEELADSTAGSSTQQKSATDSESQAKEVELEPRSTAEEDELAAALRSIEGFGDFDNTRESDMPPAELYPTATYNQSSEEELSNAKPTQELDEGTSEAAAAASALLQESAPLPQEKPSRKVSSDRDDFEPSLKLPTIRRDSTEPIKPVERSPKKSETLKTEDEPHKEAKQAVENERSAQFKPISFQVKTEKREPTEKVIKGWCWFLAEVNVTMLYSSFSFVIMPDLAFHGLAMS